MKTKGVTLVEMVMAISILGIAILTVGFSILNLQDLSELSREKVTAAADAVRVLEAMRDAANLSTANLQGTDWTVWANTQVVATKGADEIQLDQENVTVTYGGGSGNPVSLTLTVNWQHKQRPYAYQVVTRMTDRSG
jgi:prepilin-type N-terminal cleavage/methylation domain-containing protein